MELILKPETAIKELNKAFSKEFPFLKLQFYKSLDTDINLSYSEHRAVESLCLSELSKNFKEGIIKLNASKTVAGVEKEFQSKFGLTVQILRKAGEIWLETRQTDNLTLDQQNAIGVEASRPIRINRYTLFL